MTRYRFEERFPEYCLADTPDIIYVNIRDRRSFHFLVDVGKFVENYPAPPVLPAGVEIREIPPEVPYAKKAFMVRAHTPEQARDTALYLAHKYFPGAEPGDLSLELWIVPYDMTLEQVRAYHPIKDMRGDDVGDL